MPILNPSLRDQVLDRVDGAIGAAWTPADFADIAPRASVDKTLQRLAASGILRRVAWGIYDRPTLNRLTQQPAPPDYRAILNAVARRDQSRFVVDGMTAANDLGLTTAVPSKIEVLADARLRPIHLGQQVIVFKEAAPSRLFWAGRPAMRLVQALQWLHDTLRDPDQRAQVMQRVSQLLSDPDHGPRLKADLQHGYPALPVWAQELLRDSLSPPNPQSPDP